MNRADVSEAGSQRMQRRVYGRDFKLQIVRQLQSGLPPAQVGQAHQLSLSMMLRWMREWQSDPDHAFRGKGHRSPEQLMLDRLHRELEKLRAEKELLKKVLARFALKPSVHLDSSQSIERYGRLDGCARYSMSRQADITTG